MTTPQGQVPEAPGMAVQALAAEIVEALLADRKEGYDLESGLFGRAFSTLVRRWAAVEYAAQVAALTQPAQVSAVESNTAYAELPRVGAIGYASVVDIESYTKTLTIGPHLPGVRDVALWTTDQLRDFADRTHALRVASHGQAPAGAAPWRSAVLDLIDECPGLTMEQDRWLSRRVKELDFASAPRPTAQAAPAEGDWIDADDVDTLARQLDVALNGEAGAAKQASLCDVVAQVEQASRKLGRPLLAAPAAGAVAGLDWPELRNRLAMAMLGFGGRQHQTLDAASQVLDAITEPGMPLAILRVAPTPAAQADSGVQEDAAVLRVPLSGGAELCFEPYTIGSPKSLWRLRRGGVHIRWLDEFEQQHINATIRAARATGAKP